MLDISRNLFTGRFSSLSISPFLVSLNIHSNLLHGPIVFDSLPNLETADLSSNQFNEDVSLRSIGLHFTHYTLKSLSLLKNLYLPSIPSLNTQETGLNRSEANAPATTVSGAICFQLAFGNKSSISFEFDEPLFNYEQCQCDSKHFGSPQQRQCWDCPRSDNGFHSCGASSLKTRRDWFAFGYTNNSTNTTSLVELESCIYRPDHVVGVSSTNCIGTQISSRDLQNASMTLSELLQRQCNVGSDGRLCSRCICDPGVDGRCWYEKGSICQQCNRVFAPSESIGLFIGVIIGLVLVLTLIMVIILRQKRTKSTVAWQDLKLFKRIFYRFMLLTSLGHVGILITFLQLISALTNWDSYVLAGALQLLNGSGKGLGLICLFPTLSHPMSSLLVRLFLPAILVLILGLSIGLAEFLSRKLTQYLRQRRLTSFQSDDDSEGEEWKPLIPHPADSTYVPYPAMALFASLSISIIKFLYFGTAIAAHEYIFSTVQAYTGTKYVQNQPWMKFNDASTLIGTSIPFIILFDLILPLSFIYLCWRLRNTFYQPQIQIYVGSLFESFNKSAFWWEIQRTLTKLLVALVVQGVSSSSALQSSLLLSVVAITMVTQVTLTPWKRKSENLFDSISSVLVIGSLESSRMASMADSAISVYMMVCLDGLFVIASVCFIIYFTFTEPTEYERRLKGMSMNGIDNDTNEGEETFGTTTVNIEQDELLEVYSSDFHASNSIVSGSDVSVDDTETNNAKL